jgi:hypothetical protein
VEAAKTRPLASNRDCALATDRASLDPMSARQSVGVVRVPEGHRVTTFHALPEPRLVETDGGVLLAHLGLGGDDADDELDELVRQVEDALKRPRRQVVMSDHRGSLSGLFAPSDPAVAVAPAVIGWIFHSGSVDAWAGRFEQLVERMRSAVARASPATRSLAYFVDRTSARIQALAAVLAGAQIHARHTELDGDVLLEVHRPEGVVISTFRGTVSEVSTPAIADIAEPAPARLKRAPRLRRLVLAASDGDSDATWRALIGELLGREWSFLLIADSAGRVTPRQWPGSEPALPVYPDEQSFGWTVEDVGTSAPVCMASMSPCELFRWASKSGSAIALNAYRARSLPVYLVLRASQVTALARGELPPRTNR